MFDFAIGVVATLSAEFLIAHAWIWYEGRNGTTVSSIEREVRSVASAAVNVERAVVKEVTQDVKRVDQFFESMYDKPKPAQVIPPPTVPRGGGTPVPSVVMSTPQ